jgi:hypothetical protein
MAGVRGAIVGVCAAGLLGFPASSRAGSAADDWANGPVRIEGFEVEPVAGLEPGVQIPFTVYGSPGATATLRIEGARTPLALREVYGGVYEGRYVVQPDDRIAPGASATAALRRGGEIATARLADPIVEGADSGPVASAEGRAVPDAPAKPAYPASGDWAAPGASPATVPLPHPPAAPTACADCAVVEAVDAVEPAQHGVAGAIVGGLLGGLVANTAADGPHRQLARLLGAVGGAFAGHAIATRNARVAHYDVRFRLADGRTQVRRFAGALPPWRVGEVVHLDAVPDARRAGAGPARAGL